MPTASESPAAVRGPLSKTLQLLRKRLRQFGRFVLVLAACVAVAAMVLAIWWLNSLNGLPDIGDPFDVSSSAPSVFPTSGMPSHSNTVLGSSSLRSGGWCGARE